MKIKRDLNVLHMLRLSHQIFSGAWTLTIPNLGSDNANLSDRESQILVHVAEGQSAKQIASTVGRAPRTVERYIENLRHKLGARNRSHLVAIAIACGELEISPPPN